MSLSCRMVLTIQTLLAIRGKRQRVRRRGVRGFTAGPRIRSTKKKRGIGGSLNVLVPPAVSPLPLASSGRSPGERSNNGAEMRGGLWISVSRSTAVLWGPLRWDGPGPSAARLVARRICTGSVGVEAKARREPRHLVPAAPALCGINPLYYMRLGKQSGW